MHKAFLFMIHFLVCFLLSITTANSAILKQGEYLEKNQWGALEDILSDWRASKITTDECALYGCYVLALQEPSRTNRNEKIKKLPAKYKLDKKSVESGPYFFIRFLYENEEKLGGDALSEFRSSDWSDYEFWDKFKNNEKILEIISNTEFIHASFDYYCRDIVTIANKILENNIMKSEEIYIIIYFIVYKPYLNKIYMRHQNFLDKNRVGIHNPFLICEMWDYVKNSNNKKIVNIINFLSYAQNNDFFLNKLNLPFENNLFIVKGGEPNQNEKYGNLFMKYYEILCENNKFAKPVNLLSSKKVVANFVLTLEP